MTAPMNTPMNTSAWWMPSSVAGELGLGAGVRLDVEVAVPADQHRGEADEAVQQRDQLGHAGHLDHAGPPQADRRADRPWRPTSSAERRRGVDARRSSASTMVATRAMAMPAMPNVLPARGGLVLGQPGQGEDEQQRGDDVGRAARRSVRSWVIGLSSCREHGEHAAGHGEAAEDVDAGQQDRRRTASDGDRRRCAWPICSSAPTTMIPEIALVTDISGVCSAWCTLPMT